MQSLNEIFNETNVKLGSSVSDWKEAIKVGGEMLVESGICEPRYIDSMIHFAEELGPYIVLCPGFALPHSRPEDGVIETGFSLQTLSDPVDFGNEDNDPVSVVICMAAKNNEEHIETLQQIANLIENDKSFERLKSAKSLKEIHDIIQNAKTN